MSKKTFQSAVIASLISFSLLTGCSGENSGTVNQEISHTEETTLTTEGLENKGVLEGKKMEGRADKVVVTLSSPSFNTAPFAAPSACTMIRFPLYATPMTSPYYGAPLEELEPNLVKEVVSLGDNEYELHLFDYIVDSKGNKITADDVIFSYEMSTSQASFVFGASDLESLDKVDDYTLRMKTTNSLPGTIETLLTNSQLYIVDQEWYENADDQERQYDPATTGAYTITDVMAGSSITMTANDHYWQTDPAYISDVMKQNVEEIEFRVITEPSMRSIALGNNEVDVAAINASELHNFYQNGSPLEGYNANIMAETKTTALYFNTSPDNMFASDLNLRLAVLHAINSEDVFFATGGNYDTGKLAHGFEASIMGGYLDSWNKEPYFEYDVELAKEYLAKAGYQPGEVTINFLGANALPDSVYSVIRAELEEAGFNVEMLLTEVALFQKYKNDPSMFDILIDSRYGSFCTVAKVYQSYMDNYPTDEFKTLQSTLIENPDESNTDRIHHYFIDNALSKGLYESYIMNISRDSILELTTTSGRFLVPNGFVFSEEYVSGGTN